MRKRTLFALGMCAAVLLGQVSLTLAGQVQSPAPQASRQQGTQTSGQQTSIRQSQPTGKQAVGQNGAATPQNQATGQASGQKKQAPRPPAIPPGYRLLGLKEGRAIAEGIAWADDEEGLSPDCSHLVHTLYQQAGYPYPYASSLDLYRGTGPFLRVRYPHPGDLVVWRGHVGIIVNPREHSFFSTTSAGARTANYRSTYWRTRGYPHFFRYLTKSPQNPSTNHGTTEVANQPQH
ncbi:MAG TPA: NlpC/P60 family protein [Candidatus Acidoferrum sp.]|nr:NlpC/P60 family protein [Candidatus Acidoferrum sp.]